jgi:hypothetical protein
MLAAVRACLWVAPSGEMTSGALAAIQLAAQLSPGWPWPRSVLGADGRTVQNTVQRLDGVFDLFRSACGCGTVVFARARSDDGNTWG